MSWSSKAKELRAGLPALGFPIAQGSRIDVLCRTLEEATSAIQPGTENFPAAVQALRDVSEFDLAIGEFNRIGRPSSWGKNLRLALKDDVLPSQLVPDSPGRDFQAELYFCAIASRAGLCPDYPKEPDFEFVFAETVYGCAVKRLKSIGKFVDRINEASRQIVAVGRPGIVAMDISQALVPPQHFFLDVGGSNWIGKKFAEECKTLVDKHSAVLFRKDRSSLVNGALLVATSPAHAPKTGEWYLNTLTYFVPMAGGHNGRRVKFGELCDTWCTGLPSPVERV